MARVGVVIPVLNNRRYVMGFIPTITSNKHEVSICVVDNGSTDGVTEDLRNLSQQGKIHHLYIYTNALGVAAAWNLGIQKCLKHGMDYVIVANSDLLFRGDTIDALVDFYDANETLILATAVPGNDLIGLPEYSSAERNFSEYIKDLESVTLSESIVMPDFSCFLITKEFVETVGYFDEGFKGAYFEDNDAHWRIIKLGFGAAGTTLARTVHFTSRSIHEGGYQNNNFIRNHHYFTLKHKTPTKDPQSCPGWTGLMGTRVRSLYED